MKISLFLFVLFFPVFFWAAEFRVAVIGGNQGDVGYESAVLPKYFGAQNIKLFSSGKIQELADDLDSWDIVINKTLSNYKEPNCWTPGVVEQFRRYVERGGIFLLLDANYAFSLGNVLHPWGDGFNLNFDAKRCSAYHDPMGISVRQTVAQPPVSDTPYDLEKALRHIPVWQHFQKLPEAWRPLTVCQDGGAVAAYRFYGRGMVLATTFYALGAQAKRETALVGLICNSAAAVGMRNNQLSISNVELPDDFSGGNFSFDVSAETPKTITVQAGVTLNGQSLAAKEVRLALVPGKAVRFELPFAPGGRSGFLAARARVDGIPVMKSGETKPAVSAWTLRTDYYPDLQSHAAVRINAAGVFEHDSYRISVLVDGKAVPVSRAKETLYHADFSGVAPGAHKFSAAVFGADGKKLHESAVSEFTMLKQNPRYRVNVDGCLTVEGEPLFPIGFYNVSHDNPIQRARALNWALESGANILHAIRLRKDNQPDPAFGELVREAAAKKLFVITEGNSAFMEELSRTKPYPNELMRYLIDEPEIHGVSPAAVEKMHRRIRANDPDTPTYQVFCNVNVFEHDFYWRISDIVARDRYANHQVGLYYQSMRELCTAVADTGHMPLAVPQCFGGYSTGGTSYFYHIPTPELLRANTYLALIAGAKGLLFYTYYDQYFSLDNHPALRAEAIKLVREVSELAPFFLKGKHCMLEPENAEIAGAEWTLDGKTLTILGNIVEKDVSCMYQGKPLNLKKFGIAVQFSPAGE